MSIPLFFRLAAGLLLLTSALLAVDQASEEKLSSDLYKEALAYLKGGKSELAIQNLSEIIEFFPETRTWTLACNKLSELHLLNHNIKASEELLKRRLASDFKNEDQVTDILLAQWDFYSKQKQFENLNNWIGQRSANELLLLRRNPELEPRLLFLCRNAPLAKLLATCRKLGLADPLRDILDLVDKDKYIFRRSSQELLLEEAVRGGQTDLISRCARMMSKTGWHREANAIFERHAGKSEPPYMRIWINLLMDGKLWGKAVEILDRYPDNEYIKEKVVSYCGLKQWNQAYGLIIKSKKWIFHTLSVTDINEVLNGLNDDNMTGSMRDNLLAQMPDPDKKDIILALLEKDWSQKKELLNAIVVRKSIYADLAHFELSRIHYRTRNAGELSAVLQAMRTQQPDSKYIPQTALWLETLNILQSNPSASGANVHVPPAISKEK